MIPRLDRLIKIVYIGHTLTLGPGRVTISTDSLQLLNASFKLISMVMIVSEICTDKSLSQFS